MGPATEVSPVLKETVEAKIKDAFYDARNEGRTMDQAAADAVLALSPILLSADTNAHLRGRAEIIDAVREVHQRLWGGEGEEPEQTSPGHYCDYCSTLRQDYVNWPCATARAIGVL